MVGVKYLNTVVSEKRKQGGCRILSNSIASLHRQELTCHQLPLAVYREIVAHLRQIEGVNAGLLPQKSQEFDYLQSQVGGLWIEIESEIESLEKNKIDSILNYYGEKYGSFSAIAN